MSASGKSAVLALVGLVITAVIVSLVLLPAIVGPRQPVASAQVSTALDYRFGPVIQISLNDVDATPQNSFIDLDSGTLFTPPDEIAANFDARVPQIWEWIANNGIDAWAHVEIRGGEVIDASLGLMNCIVVQAPGLPWETLRPDDVRSILGVEQGSRPERSFEYHVHARDGAPLVYVFETREGGQGMLRVLGPANGGQAVIFEYRLLQSAGPSIRY